MQVVNIYSFNNKKHKIVYCECLLRLEVLRACVLFCCFLYGPFCHGALKLDMLTVLTTLCFLHISSIYIYIY